MSLEWLAQRSGFEIIWIVTGAFVFVAWLVISFTKPSRGRTVLEWCGASVMYVGLLTLFVHWLLRANATGNTLLLVAVGFLCVLFSGGLLISLWHTFSSLGPPKKTETSAVH